MRAASRQLRLLDVDRQRLKAMMQYILYVVWHCSNLDISAPRETRKRLTRETEPDGRAVVG